jgi:hypothetical protein
LEEEMSSAFASIPVDNKLDALFVGVFQEAFTPENGSLSAQSLSVVIMDHYLPLFIDFNSSAIRLLC